MKLSDYIAQFLYNNKISTVFGYQGGNIAHFIDSINKQNNIDFVSTYNEQGASYAACSYSLVSDNLGAALASSGPGAINLLSGIANAFYDSIPCIFFTGNVSAHTIKTNENIRQNAFQENDIVSMVQKITKYAVTVKRPEEIRFHLEKALFLAKSGRPGPVLLDLPHNVQKAEIIPEKLNSYSSIVEDDLPDKSSIDRIIEIVKAAKKPLILAGGGLIDQFTRKLFNRLLDVWRIPVVTTLRGLDVISHKSDLFAGFGGAYGNRSANLAVYNSDVLIVLGSRLDERFIATSNKDVFMNKQIIHVDIDKYELGRIFLDEITINSNLSMFLKALLDRINSKINCSKWISTINQWKIRYSSIDTMNIYNINNIIRKITENCDDNAIYTGDVGLNLMCLAQSAMIVQNQRIYTSSGLGAMGCSLPLAIGAAYATNKRNKILCFVGDGGLHMNIQELLLIKKENLPIHVILLNNNCLGMIRDFQAKAFKSTFIGTVKEFQTVDYEAIAKAYGLPYKRVTRESELNDSVEFVNSVESGFIEFVLPEDTNTNPLLGKDMFCELPELSAKENLLIQKEVTECENTIY